MSELASVKFAKALLVRSQLGAFFATLKNKAAAIIVLVVMAVTYHALPDNLPFMEVFYTLLTILACVVVAPLLRVLVFNEASQYAESGCLVKELQYLKFTPALIHYWIATIICYAIVILGFSSITK